MSAPSAHDPNDLGGGWFQAPGHDLDQIEDPLAGADQPRPPQHYPDAMGDPSGTDAYWDSRAKRSDWSSSSGRRRNLVGASMVKRFFAHIIDTIVIALLWVMVFSLGILAELGETEITLVFSVALGVLASMIYFVGSELLLGTTMGKAILGMKVVSSTGAKPSLGESFIRNFWRMANAFAHVVYYSGTSYEMHAAIASTVLLISLAVTGERGQGWHDRLAGCYVINRGY